MRFIGLFIALIALTPLAALGDDSTPSPFAHRGYYFTFSRMPTYGLEEWKQIIDCVRADEGNAVVLWIGGGFRSRKFPETWKYNQDHANVKLDFVKSLIDYAHTKEVAVLLGFTPFGYDGVNQMSLTRPDWRATGPDGKTTARFGFHSWGYNLCPGREDTRKFMLEYIRELCIDFYPNADGLMIESSDYAVCHCKDCGAKFYEHEFGFVKEITETVRKNNPDAIVTVYPHYFTGAKVPGLPATAAKLPFDRRWTLFYTPHSAHPEASLTKEARGAIWSDAAVARETPAAIRDGARRARDEGCTGYIPSFEVFTYVPTDPEEGQPDIVGKRQVPFGFGWLKEKQIPYNELPARVNRVAFREYTRDPDLPEADFRAALGKELFGERATDQAVDDALFLQKLFATGRLWVQPAPAVSPNRVRTLSAASQFSERQRAECREALQRVRAIESRSRLGGEAFAELHRIAEWVTEQWAGDAEKLLAP